jgi:tetratricopeptide (TPR) repeat protein
MTAQPGIPPSSFQEQPKQSGAPLPPTPADPDPELLSSFQQAQSFGYWSVAGSSPDFYVPSYLEPTPAKKKSGIPKTLVTLGAICAAAVAVVSWRTLRPAPLPTSPVFVQVPTLTIPPRPPAQNPTLVAEIWQTYRQGAALSYRGNNRQALTHFSRLIQLSPDAVNYYNRGIIHYLAGYPQAAVADLDQSVLLDPTMAVSYYLRGNIRYEMGDRQGAFQDFRQGLSVEPSYMDPDDEHGFYARGLAKSRLGDVVGARLDLQTAAEISQRHNNTTFLRQVNTALSQLP